MENPEVRVKSSRPVKRISVKSGSSEAFEKDSSQGGASSLLHLVKTSPRYLDPTVSSLNLAGKSSKEKTPRLSDYGLQTRRLSEDKGSSRVTELESHIFQLENKLDIVKDQLISAESLKKEAQKDAEESRKKLLAISKKFEDSQKRVSESAALVSAMEEIRLLKEQLESQAVFQAAHKKQSESKQKQLQQMRAKLQDACFALEDLKVKISEAKRSEALALETIDGTLLQLLEAKVVTEVLNARSCEAAEACEAVASELRHSRAHVKFLEERNLDQNEFKLEEELLDEMDIATLKLELEGLKAALEASCIRYDEELIRKEEETEDAVEIIKIINSASKQRQDELEAEIRRSKKETDELTENLLDMETKLQPSHQQNAVLLMQINSKNSVHRKLEMEMEMNNLKAETESLKAHLTVKEMELENAATESTALKLYIKKMSEANIEKEAAMEIEKKNKEFECVVQELETIERKNSEMECELRKLKLQAEQWKKAAEVAASMVAAENDGMLSGKLGSPARLSCGDEEMRKKRNGNLLKKFGVLWKKQQHK